MSIAMSFTVETLHPNALEAADIAAWRAVQAGEAALASPLLGPDFAAAVGEVRADARVAVARRGGEPVAFFAYHARPGGLARPIGAPFSDYHGLVARADAGLAISDILQAAGLSTYRFSHLLGSVPRDGEGVGYLIRLTDGAEAYLEALRTASPKRFKNIRRLESKLEREVGPLRLSVDADPAVFETLLAWKRDQFRRTGAQDVLRPEWSRQLMRTVFDSEGGLMMALHAGDTLVAGHFGIRVAERYHPWIASANPQLEAYSPGQTFITQAIRGMPGLGLVHYDLGPSHDHYKRPFALDEVRTAAGIVTAAGEHRGAPGRIGARLDRIAAVELSLGGRLRGIAQAMAAQARRRTEDLAA